MICETVLGNRNMPEFYDCMEDKLRLEWDEVYKRVLKKTTEGGVEVGIRLSGPDAQQGLCDGDVLWRSGNKIITVEIIPCRVIRIESLPERHGALIQAAYEIGNRHAPLFWTLERNGLVIVYDEFMLPTLQKIYGISLSECEQKLDPHLRIRTLAFHSHSHTHML